MGYEENDESLIPEIQELLNQFEINFESIRIKTLLSGEYDSNNAIVKLNAGAGGTESCDWAGMLYACTPDGQKNMDLPLKCWIIWMEMKRVSSP